jgi:hypothetical protein
MHGQTEGCEELARRLPIEHIVPWFEEHATQDRAAETLFRSVLRLHSEEERRLVASELRRRSELLSSLSRAASCEIRKPVRRKGGKTP